MTSSGWLSSNKRQRVVHSDSAKAFSLSNRRLKMNDQQKKEQYSGVRDQEIRAALVQHWAASDANDFETEHRIYHEDAVLEYPQSGEQKAVCGPTNHWRR